MDRKIVGFLVALLVVFGIGYFSGSKDSIKQARLPELHQISNEFSALPEFAELAKKLQKVEESLPKFATKADVEKAIAEARELITDEIDANVKAAQPSMQVSYAEDSDLQQRVLALEAKVAKLESVCTPTTSASVAPVKSGGSSGGSSVVSVSSVPVVTTTTYQTVATSEGSGSWGSNAAYPAVNGSTKRVRVVEPWQPRQVSVVDVPDDTSVSAFGVSSGQCYVDPITGQTVCPNATASSGRTVATRQGLLGRILRR